MLPISLSPKGLSRSLLTPLVLLTSLAFGLSLPWIVRLLQASTAQGTASVTGQVTYRGEPVRLARIEFRGKGGARLVTTTNTEGWYDVSLPSGWVAVAVALPDEFRPVPLPRNQSDLPSPHNDELEQDTAESAPEKAQPKVLHVQFRPGGQTVHLVLGEDMNRMRLLRIATAEAG